jgi:hypothetical protein
MTPGAAGRARMIHHGPREHWLLDSLGEFNRDQLGFYVRCAREYGTSCRCAWALAVDS